MSVGSTPSSGSILAPDSATPSRLVRAKEASANGRSTLGEAPGPGVCGAPAGGRLDGGGAGVIAAFGAESDGASGVNAGMVIVGPATGALLEGSPFSSLLQASANRAAETRRASAISRDVIDPRYRRDRQGGLSWNSKPCR